MLKPTWESWRQGMDIHTFSGLALFSIGMTLVVVFEAVERYDSPRLMTLLMSPPESLWTAWLLNVSVMLFAPKTALTAIGYRYQVSGITENRIADA